MTCSCREPLALPDPCVSPWSTCTRSYQPIRDASQWLSAGAALWLPPIQLGSRWDIIILGALSRFAFTRGCAAWKVLRGLHDEHAGWGLPAMMAPTRFLKLSYPTKLEAKKTTSPQDNNMTLFGTNW